MFECGTTTAAWKHNTCSIILHVQVARPFFSTCILQNRKFRQNTKLLVLERVLPCGGGRYACLGRRSEEKREEAYKKIWSSKLSQNTQLRFNISFFAFTCTKWEKILERAVSPLSVVLSPVAVAISDGTWYTKSSFRVDTWVVSHSTISEPSWNTFYNVPPTVGMGTSSSIYQTIKRETVYELQ